MTLNLFKQLFFSFFLLTAVLVHAQKNHFGAYFGPTLSSLRMEQLAASDVFIDPFDYKFGVTFGIYGTLGISDNVSIRGELNYERKGGRSGVLLSDGNGNPLPGRHIDEHFDYFQVPALFQLSAGKDFKVFIHVGYAIGYLLHRTDEFPGEINVVIDNQQAPPTRYVLYMPESYKQFDHSFVAGVGASPVLSNGLRPQFGLRVYNGRLDIARGRTSFDTKNLSLALLLGLEF